MKSKIHLEIYESEILKSITSQSKDDTFDFIEKMLHDYEYPTEIAHELIERLETFIDRYQRNEWEHEMFEFMDDSGKLHGKYKAKRKKARINKKTKSRTSDDKPEYCLK